ncbi:MAG: glycosyltransferase, partial [Chitinophagales bacterium]|nr:glycosyltransferase [Chitinophagales bacterium]
FLQSAAILEGALKKFVAANNLIDSELIIYSNWADWRALAATQVSKNVIAVSRAHNADVYFERHPKSYLPFRKLLLENLDAVFFISENGKAYTVSKMLGGLKKDLLVARLGTPFKGRNPDADEKVLTVVSCSRMDRVKRIDLIGDILCKSNLPIRWIHFGDGNSRNELEVLRKEWMKKLPSLTIEFMGNVSNEQVMQFYLSHHVDLFINTSEYEGIPVAMMEAMSTGIPVMATNAGGVNELVNDENGKLIQQPVNIEEAAKWLHKFYSLSSEEKKLKREKAFEMWNKNFNAAINSLVFAKELLELKK